MAQQNDIKRILIADDSSNMLRTLANMLRQLGYEDVVRAENGEKALARLHHQKVDLVLTDWNMPKMKGVELLRAMRDSDEFKSIPVIMITGERDPGIVAEAAEIEVDAYVLKPFTLKDLRLKIDEVMEKKRTPNPIDIHLAVTKVYVEGRQYEEAMEELKKALKVNPKHPRVSYMIGHIYELQKDFENAEKFYNRAVEFGKHFLIAHEALARIYEAKGDLEAASKELKKAVHISPKNIDRQLGLSQILVKTGKKEEVQKLLKNVVELANEKRADVAVHVGQVYLEVGMAGEAQQMFSQALRADPNAIHIYNKLGIALRRQKKFREAVENYLLALKMEPDNEGLLYNLGRAYWENGNKDKSIQVMKRALKFYPEFEEARRFLEKVGAAEG